MKRDPEAQRAWQAKCRARALERQQEASARRERRRSEGLRPSRRRRKVTIPAGTRTAVKARTLGVCAVCLEREGVDLERISVPALERLVSRGVLRLVHQMHHVLDEHDWPHLAKLSRNLIGVCHDCHSAHHFQPDGRIPRACLPAETLELAEAEGLTWYIERTYPAPA